MTDPRSTDALREYVSSSHRAEAELDKLLAELAAARTQLADAQTATGNAGMTLAEWDEWSNELADLLPEAYDDDIAQEALITNAVGDMAADLAACRAREAAIRQLGDEIHGHGADTLEGEIWRLRGILNRIDAVLGDETGTGKAEPLADSWVEAAAIALYEHSRGHVYVGAEWDWPNIDNSYDRDDEDEYPEGVTPDPEWLRNRFRASARAALTAAGSVGAQDQGSTE